MRRFVRLSAPSVCLAVAALGSVSHAAPAPPTTTWYSIITESGAVIGHGSHQLAQTSSGREITDTQEVDVVDEGTPAEPMSFSRAPKMRALISRTVRQEDGAGHTLSIDSRSENGRDWARIEARISADNAEIIRTTPVEARTIHVSLLPAVRFDNGVELLRSWNPATTPRLEFDNFNIDAMAVEHVAIEVLPKPANASGLIAALRKRFDGKDLIAVSHLLIDSDGRIAEATQPMPSAQVTVRMTGEKTALTPVVPYRAVPNVMRKSIVRIPPSSMQAHLRYRFAFQNGIAFSPPETSEQRVTVEAGNVTIDVCGTCGPGLPVDAAYLDDARKPTVWLQSDDRKLKAIAAPIAAMQISDARKMELLRQTAKPYLGRVDFTGHYSALETLSRHAADCTEAAVLLAALGRAAGIPTRVANGLVYSRESYHGVSNAWMPHSWTLAFVDGKWRSFDLALDEFDSTHIALHVSDGDERSLLAAGQRAGLLDWQSIVEVRAKPGN